jgi:hypothetical protein
MRRCFLIEESEQLRQDRATDQWLVVATMPPKAQHYGSINADPSARAAIPNIDTGEGTNSAVTYNYLSSQRSAPTIQDEVIGSI